jgi:putative methionine-R-sulfoxide reductase with GAF domain
MDQPWSAAQPTTSVESSEGSLLWTLEEIARLVSQRGDPAETLTNVVHLIQQRFQTDVCSVYLLETDRANLVLAATIGLRPDSVGRVRMRITEGLAGLVAQRLQPQIVADATAHPGSSTSRKPARIRIDVWSNNPRRPLEACGTSGQKVVLNGGLNLSVLDGWWAEAYDGQNGFAIGGGETHSNADIHDRNDGAALIRVLRDEVIPLYYDRDQDGLPRGWIRRMKRSIRTLGRRFSADRMVMDYVTRFYIPAAGGTSADTR